jgi:hypothetical protein
MEIVGESFLICPSVQRGTRHWLIGIQSPLCPDRVANQPAPLTKQGCTVLYMENATKLARCNIGAGGHLTRGGSNPSSQKRF